jgi:protocatechuate 4,5-dioxygenase alpha chain
MSQEPAVSASLDPPDTFLYTGPLSTRGARVNRFGLSLRSAENRAVFLADEAAYMSTYGLTATERGLVSRRDWTGLLAAGCHLQTTVKIAAAVGQNLWHIGAHNAGMSVEELMAICPRPATQAPVEAP